MESAEKSSERESRGRLRSEIAQLEARYDDHFPPGVYAVLERLRGELAALEQAFGDHTL